MKTRIIESVLMIALIFTLGCSKVAYLPSVTSEVTVSGSTATILFDIGRQDDAYVPRLEFDSSNKFKSSMVVPAEMIPGEDCYKVVLEGLQPNTNYYIRYIVSNSAGGSIIVNKGESFATSSASGMEYGELPGRFSVSENQTVCFSQGNLQYKVEGDVWRFASNQFDYLGMDNQNISSSSTGWIDYFGWGTSGYNHGAICYQPWSTSNRDVEYSAYGNYDKNLYDQTGQADWGYNVISNGGNAINTWRTLNHDEWNYVFNTRITASGARFAKAIINDVNGVVLLPDNWVGNDIHLNDVNDGGSGYNSNVIDAAQCKLMQQAGAVFLPSAGGRDKSEVVDLGWCGYYWSSSRYDVIISGSNGAYAMAFGDDVIDCSYPAHKHVGFSVRLVRNK